MLKLIVPFIKTSVNMSDEFFESIPMMTLLGKNETLRNMPLVGAMIRRLRDRTLTPMNAWKRQQVLGKQMAMIPLVSTVMYMHSQGDIQGFGPRNLTENRLARESGALVPYSVKINGVKYKFDHLVEPLGMAFRVSTRLAELADEILFETDRGTISIEDGAAVLQQNTTWGLDMLEDLFTIVASGITEVTEVLPLDGPHRAFSAAVGGEKVMASYAADLLATLLPLGGLVSQHNRGTNDYQTMSKGFVQRFQSKSLIPLGFLDKYLGTDFEGAQPVPIVDFRTGKLIDNYGYWTNAIGFKMSPEMSPTTEKFVATNGHLLNLAWRAQDLTGLDLSADRQLQWQLIRAQDVTIGGLRLHEALDKAMAVADKRGLADADDVDTQYGKKTPGVELVNDILNKYNKATDEKFFAENRSLAVAKEVFDLNNKLVEIGLSPRKIPKNTFRKGSVEELEEVRKLVVSDANQQITSKTKAAQDIYQNDSSKAFNKE
jgi:hypothetical protein